MASARRTADPTGASSSIQQPPSSPGSPSSPSRKLRLRSSDKSLPSVSPRTDKNFLVPRTEPPRTGVHPWLQMQQLEASMLLQAAERQQQLIQQQYQAWYPEDEANGNTSTRSPQQRPVPLRGSNESLYYHPTTTRQPPPPDPNQPHIRTRSSDPAIHRPSTAPPQQLRSVLSPPQPPERYRTPRPRSPFEEFVFPGQFFCKRCQKTLPTKDSFHAHMLAAHGRGPGHVHARS